MKLIKRLLRTILASLGVRVTRSGRSFQAMDEALFLLRSFGYVPKRIVDGGANMGTWTEMARCIFPEARFDLIEPQSACLSTLNRLARSAFGVTVHPVAVTAPGVERVRLIGGGQSGGGTGAWVASENESSSDAVECPATTLDALLAASVRRDDRALLKLDLEGHEIQALRGATRLLEVTEVVLSEVQFFQNNDNGKPVFADLLSFLGDRGFELYDFACLSPRPRDKRLRMGDVIFVHRDSPLLADRSWQ